MIEAEIRKRANLPVVTRRLRDIAKLAIERMDNETVNKQGKVSYVDYKRIIEDYLIPIWAIATLPTLTVVRWMS